MRCQSRFIIIILLFMEIFQILGNCWFNKLTLFLKDNFALVFFYLNSLQCKTFFYLIYFHFLHYLLSFTSVFCNSIYVCFENLTAGIMIFWKFIIEIKFKNNKPVPMTRLDELIKQSFLS